MHSPSLSYLILMLTDRCNLSCCYCYLGNRCVPSESSQATDIPYPFIDRALDLVPAGKDRCHFQISGGEPFLVPRRVEYAVMAVRERLPDTVIGLQTNGTVLDHALLDLIRESGVRLGVSLDGDPGIQDLTRGKAGRVFTFLYALESRNIPFNVTTVVSSINADKLHRLVLALAPFSMARGIGLDCLVVKGRAAAGGPKPSNPMQPDPVQLDRGVHQMIQALIMVNSGRKIPIICRELEKVKSAYPTDAFCRAARAESLAVTPQGDLYPCSQTAFDPDFFLGNLASFPGDMKPSPLTSYRLFSENREACRNCPLEGKCPQECPSRLHYNRNHNPELACALYRSLACHAGVAGKEEHCVQTV